MFDFIDYVLSRTSLFAYFTSTKSVADVLLSHLSFSFTREANLLFSLVVLSGFVSSLYSTVEEKSCFRAE